jgi:hypothetical protein
MLYPDLIATEDLGAHVEHCAVTATLIMRAALIKNLRRFDDGLKAQVPKDWRVVDRRKRTIITLLGEIAYHRRVYLDGYGCRRYLLDEVLGIAPRQRIEPAAFLWLVRKAADVSYRKAARAFGAMSGTPVTPQSVMRCVHRAGGLLESISPDTSGALSVPVLFAEFDGFWVHLQSEKKQRPALCRRTYKEQFMKKSAEMKVWVAYGGKEGNRRLHALHWASDAGPEAFFGECLEHTGGAYDTDGIDYLVVGSDGASWCKAHGLDTALWGKAAVISTLDAYHMNQKLYRAFTDEADRSEYLGLLYAKDYKGLVSRLDGRMAAEPDHERAEKRRELRSYIMNNLDWLCGPSLARHIRERLLCELPAVFGDRGFCGHLHGLLEGRRYKRFLEVLGEVAGRCADGLRHDYECFLADAADAIAVIRRYAPVGLGTMEGTNSKVYAARLKVWGCSWSRRGAIAMMRVRAAIASGTKLLAPSYDAWLTGKERARIEKWRGHPAHVPENAGKGYVPPQGSVLSSKHLTPQLYGLVRG